MTRDEVKGLFKRIKSNYPSFIFDDYKLTEWCNELKDYSEIDIHKKLEEHMRNEQYGNQEPKLYFLTKYLVKESEKDKRIEYTTFCPLCHKELKSNVYDNHFDRCSSIDYILRQIDKYNIQTKANKLNMWNLSDIQFEEFYEKIMKIVYERTKDEREKKLLGRILYNQDYKVSDILE